MQYKLFITYMEFIIILFLLVLNGVFAMYEIALVSSSKARLETLAGKGNKRAKGVLKQLEEPEKFLSTIQIGITLIGIVSGAFGGVAIADNVAPLFASIPGSRSLNLIRPNGVAPVATNYTEYEFSTHKRFLML